MNEKTWIEWRNLIGSFMMRFAEVEFELFRGMIDLGGHEQNELRNMEFSKRINKFKNYICKLDLPETRKTELYTISEQLFQLAAVRNLIAHNPINISFESIFDGEPSLEVRSIRDSDISLSKKELEIKLESLTICGEHLYELLSEAHFRAPLP